MSSHFEMKHISPEYCDYDIQEKCVSFQNNMTSLVGYMYPTTSIQVNINVIH